MPKCWLIALGSKTCLDCHIALGVVRSLVPEVAGNWGFRDGFRDTQTMPSVAPTGGSFQDTPARLDKPIKQRMEMAWRGGHQRVKGKQRLFCNLFLFDR